MARKERVELSGDRVAEVWRARPVGEVRGRALVLAESGRRDSDGLALARRLAAAELDALCLAPDPSGAQRDDRRSLADLESLCAHWSTTGQADEPSLAVVGLGSEGTLAFLFACVSRRPAAAVLVDAPIAYAELSALRPSQPLEMALNLSCPLLALYGDETVAGAEIDALEERLARFFLPADVERVPVKRVGLSPEDAASYHEASARRVVGFLLETLCEPDEHATP